MGHRPLAPSPEQSGINPRFGIEPRWHAARVNLGSESHLPGPTLLGIPTQRWLYRSDKAACTFFAPLPHGIVLGVWDEEPVPDYFEWVRPEVRVLDPQTGLERYCLKNRAVLDAAGSLMVCRAPDRTPARLEVRAVRDGTCLGSLEVPDSCGASIASTGLLVWNSQAPGWISSPFALNHHPWNALDIQQPVPIEPRQHVAWAREEGGLLAIGQWSSEGEVTCSLEVLDWPGGLSRWRFRPGCYTDGEVFPSSQGWVTRSQQITAGYSREGIQQWTAPGLTRCWVSPEWVLGCEAGTNHLIAIQRSSGTVHRLEGLADPWAIALSGDSVWMVDRARQRWLSWRLNGGLGWEGRQPHVGPYGIHHLRVLQDRLIAVSDTGDCMAFTVEQTR